MQTPQEERYSKGQTIITEGIMAQKAYVIIAGEVAISKKVGGRNVTVSVLKEGDIFGEMGLFQETIRSASVTARGDVVVGIIDRDYFSKMLEDCPEDMRKIVGSLIDRLRNITEKLAVLGLKLEQAKRSIDSFSSKETLE